MAELLLPSGDSALIDDEDLDRTTGYGWYLCQTSRKTGKPKKYVMGYIPKAGRPAVYLHRLVLDAPRGVLVDHRDGNTLDCRKGNLRLANRNQNAWNRAPNSSRNGLPLQSHFKGVSREGERWKAKIGYLSVQYLIGIFEDEISAAEAYDDFAHWLHGDFSFRNFPERPPQEFRGTVIPKGVTKKAVKTTAF